MEIWERECYVNKILSDVDQCKIYGREFLLREPSTFDKWRASQIYQETHEKAVAARLFSDDEISSLLILNGMWSLEEENKIKALTDDLPELKVKCFQSSLKNNERTVIKQAIKDTKDKIEELMTKKHIFDFLTCSGLAYTAKNKFLVGCSIYYASGKKYWSSHKGWERPDNLIDEVVSYLNTSRITDTIIRELARSDPWRSIWNSAKHSGRGVFDKAAVDLNDYQKTLIQYSKMYDTIYENAEVSEEVIEDDDMLDGWMIVQKRDREKDSTKKMIEDKIGNNAKIANGEEIFIMADTEEDAKKIVDCNDIGGKIAFHQRMQQIKKEGVVKDVDLIDQRQHINTLAVNAASQAIKGR